MNIIVDTADAVVSLSKIPVFSKTTHLYEEYINSDREIKGDYVLYVVTAKTGVIRKIINLIKVLRYEKKVLVSFPNSVSLSKNIDVLGEGYVRDIINNSSDAMGAIVSIMPGAPEILHDYKDDFVKYMATSSGRGCYSFTQIFKKRFFLKPEDIIGDLFVVNDMHYVLDDGDFRRVCNFRIHAASKSIVDDGKVYYRITLYTNMYEIVIYPGDRVNNIVMRYPGINVSSMKDLFYVMSGEKNIVWKTEIPSGFKNGVFYPPSYNGEHFTTPSLEWVVLEKNKRILDLLNLILMHKNIISTAQSIIDYVMAKKFFIYYSQNLNRFGVVKKALEIIGVETPMIIHSTNHNRNIGSSISNFFPKFLVLNGVTNKDIDFAKMSLGFRGSYEFPVLIIDKGGHKKSGEINIPKSKIPLKNFLPISYYVVRELSEKKGIDLQLFLEFLRKDMAVVNSSEIKH